jgi:two-component system LytT family sensor kinase
MKDGVSSRGVENPNWWRVWVGFLPLWTTFAVVGTYFNYQFRMVHERPISWFQAMRMNTFAYGTWAMVLTPLILLLCAKIPLAKRHWLRLALAHSLSIAGIVCVDVLIKTLWGVNVFPGMKPRPFAAQFRRVLFSEAEPDIQIYLVVAVIGYVVAYYTELRNEERNRAELETHLVRADLQVLRMQLQPHFLFNALHSVSALVRTDPRAAQKMICSLGDLLRMSLAGQDLPEATLRSELEFLQLYLDIQRVRFQGQLTAEINIESDVLDAKVPYLLLQPLAENAIKHGVARRSGGKVEICAYKESDTVCVRVGNDNGALPDVPEHERLGIGLDNIRSRLRILYGAKGRLSARPLSDGRFEVEVRVPFQARPISYRETHSPSPVALGQY